MKTETAPEIETHTAKYKLLKRFGSDDHRIYTDKSKPGSLVICDNSDIGTFDQENGPDHTDDGPLYIDKDAGMKLPVKGHLFVKVSGPKVGERFYSVAISNRVAAWLQHKQKMTLWLETPYLQTR